MAGKFGIEPYGLKTGTIFYPPPVGLHTPNTHPQVNTSKSSMLWRIEKAV